MKAHIAILDDQPRMAQILAMVLDDDAYEITTYNEPKRFLSAVESGTLASQEVCSNRGSFYAVSLEAAKENLSLINENAVDYLLSDGFPTKPFKKPCELIFTNPPVHYQSKPDFRVLGKMLLHLPNVLKKRKKGTCFCVCQRYVPLESVAKYFIDDDARENGKGNRTQLDVEIHAKNDRFVVWKISLPS